MGSSGSTASERDLPAAVPALGLILALALAGCASGRQAEPGVDADPTTDGTIHFTDSGGGPDADRGVAPLDTGSAEAPLPVDQDGDGHCPPKTPDPGRLCKSFGDCDDSDPSRHPGALELCANVGGDNDCDGDAAEVDEDEDGQNDLGAPCDSGLPGICAAGLYHCAGATLACAAKVKVGQQSETCDGTDEDCDGTPDNGQLCTNGNSCDGAAGCRCGGKPPCTGTSQCVGGSCTTCQPGVNLALQATASSSGGGSVAGYLPAQMNNGQLQSSCNFHWISATSKPAGKWIQYTWSKPVTFNHVWIDTTPTSGTCGMSSGRCLAGGTFQYWTGSSWSSLGTVGGKSGKWSHSFPQVTSTKLRLHDAHACSNGYAKNPMIFEWRVFCQ